MHSVLLQKSGLLTADEKDGVKINQRKTMASRPRKKLKLFPPHSNNGDGSFRAKDAGIQKGDFKSAATWDLEHEYESRRKKSKKREKESKRLPIKTADGRVEHVPDQGDAASVGSDADWLESQGDEESLEPKVVVTVPEAPKSSEREQILKAQEELANLASRLNREPEEHPGAFKELANIGNSPVPAIQRLAMVAQLSVYKDVIPGYRIRPANGAAGEKVSKEVKKLQKYETALIAGYKKYLESLARSATSKPATAGKRGPDMASIAIICACTLLNAVPHFNFRGELLRILVRKLSARRTDASFIKCREALETLFREDEEGRASMEAIQLLTKMMKTRSYRVEESVLNLFLDLRLLSEMSRKATQDSRSSGLKKKVFRNKKERKLLREQKQADKVAALADATVRHEETEHMQSETLKMVFATYFRILKQRSSHLVGAVLEGLAAYSHLVNQDYFGDLLEALKDLVRDSQEDVAVTEDDEARDDSDDDSVPAVRDTNRKALLCTITAFVLLAGQDAHNARSELHLDLSFFTSHLFQGLPALCVDPDLELGARSLRLHDPSARTRNNKVNLQTTTVLLLRCLKATLLPQWNLRSVPPLRLAAFTKQLMSGALHMPEMSTQAMLALLQDVAHMHGKKVAALWNTAETKRDGMWNPFSASVEGSNPFAATVWEGELLRRHYSPKVRDGAKALEKKIGTV